MVKLVFTFLLALTLTTTQSLTAETAKYNPARSITLNGIIDNTTLARANELSALAESSKEPIDVLIASPGGVISYGLYFIQAIKLAEAKGVKVRCFVPAMAASMAYTIFTQCTERYALPYAQLLFHPPRVSGNMLLTPAGAANLAQGLADIEMVLLKLIIPAMQVTEENGGDWFVESYQNERLFVASDLLQESPVKWFSVVGKIDGCQDLFPDPYNRANQLESRQTKRGGYLYIKTTK